MLNISSLHLLPYNVGNTRINPQLTINRWYKPFPHGWFTIVFLTL